MAKTLAEANKRIAELEKEVARLNSELETYRSKNFGGRRKHDETWTNSYNGFAEEFSNGKTIMEIVSEGKISRRTAYRYKAYYDELQKMKAKERSEEQNLKEL